eukprot:1149776-Pelagomonas_calceolata.AAC.5
MGIFTRVSFGTCCNCLLECAPAFNPCSISGKACSSNHLPTSPKEKIQAHSHLPDLCLPHAWNTTELRDLATGHAPAQDAIQGGTEGDDVTRKTRLLGSKQIQGTCRPCSNNTAGSTWFMTQAAGFLRCSSDRFCAATVMKAWTQGKGFVHMYC